MATYAFTDEPGDAPRGRCHHPRGPEHRHGHPLAVAIEHLHQHPMAGGPGGRHGGPGRFAGGGRFGGHHDHPDRPGGGPFGGGPGWGGPPWGRGPGGRGPGGRGPGGRGGRGPRAARGDIRAGILVLLGEEPMHGYQVMRELADRSGGVWRPSPGSIYPTLQQLQDEGLVSSEEQAGGRRLFSLTDEGRTEVEKRSGDKAPWDAVSEDASAPQMEFRNLFHQVAAASRQVAEAGSDEQVGQAAKILKDARRALYRILAEDDDDAPASPADVTDAPAA